MQLIVGLRETTGDSSSFPFFVFFLFFSRFKPALTQGPDAIRWLQSERCIAAANPFELLSWRFHSVAVIQLARREFSQVCFGANELIHWEQICSSNPSA